VKTSWAFKGWDTWAIPRKSYYSKRGETNNSSEKSPWSKWHLFSVRRFSGMGSHALCEGARRDNSLVPVLFLSPSVTWDTVVTEIALSYSPALAGACYIFTEWIFFLKNEDLQGKDMVMWDALDKGNETQEQRFAVTVNSVSPELGPISRSSRCLPHSFPTHCIEDRVISETWPSSQFPNSSSWSQNLSDHLSCDSLCDEIP
jgi:hypothetical protein